MKELYSFEIKRTVEEEVSYAKKTEDGTIEATKQVKKEVKDRIVFVKPSFGEVEDADFFYGQKYNEYINAGFLTKAMLAKKMGDLGGLTSKIVDERVATLMVENMEAARTIEFFEGAKDITEEQEKKLKDAKETFASSRAELHDYEVDVREQFSHTADSKAEVKLIEWIVLHFSYFEDEVGEGKQKKKDLFPIFEGEDYELKRASLVKMQEEDDSTDITFLRRKMLFEESFNTLIKVASIWYNKMGDDQESIKNSLKHLFASDEE